MSINVHYNVRTTYNGNLVVFLPSEHGSDGKVFVNNRGTFILHKEDNHNHGWERKVGLTKSEAFAVAAIVSSGYYGNAGAKILRLQEGAEPSFMSFRWTSAVYALAAEKLRGVQTARLQEEGTGGGLE